MQKVGGSRRMYTRKRKQTHYGGGNNPACGCDMQVGWPKFLTENIPMPSQQGGGALLGATAYNSNPVPDACPFPGTGYCGFYAKGGSCGLLPQQGGANYGEPMSLQAKLRGGSWATTYQRGGSWATTDQRGGSSSTTGLRGGGCGCLSRKGGAYRPTKKNLKALKKWRKGQSIGFTMTSSLKAKGLIPRTSRKHRGKKVVSAKYA